MRASKATLILSAAALLSLGACGTAKRFGKDVFVTVGSPVLIPFCAANDAYETSQSVSEGLGGSSLVTTLTMPFTFFYHAIEHSIYTAVHFVDGALCPLYGCAEISPAAHKVEPLKIYDGTWFDGKPAGTDPMSGEQMDAGN